VDKYLAEKALEAKSAIEDLHNNKDKNSQKTSTTTLKEEIR